MDLAYTDEQKLLADSASRFFADNYDLPKRRERVASDSGFSEALWSEMADLGWLALRLPEDFGGLDFGAVESALVCEALGSALAVEPLTSSAVTGAVALRLGADSAVGEAFGAKLAAGKCRFALAQAEPRSRYSLARVATRATASGGTFALTGEKAVVFNAPGADQLIVSARTSGDDYASNGVTLFLVSTDADGLSMRSYPTVDGMRAAEISFNNTPAHAVLGKVDHGMPLLERIVDETQIALSAEAVGAMSYLLSATVEYAKTRKQFERTLSSFQVIQHRLVDMYNALETAKAMTFMAAAGMNIDDDTERHRLATTAKIKVGDAAKLVGEDAVQIHGGMGMTDELDIGHYFKRITMIAQTYGDNDYQLKQLAAMMRG
ncbi:MAG: acyl-CoA dehydrogenase family protein [Pseudomonadota bacterium]